jgi:polar amino acid transport system substrate-binding protein
MNGKTSKKNMKDIRPIHLISSIIALSLCIIIAPVLAQPVKVGTTHFPPYYVVKEDGTLSGILLEVMLTMLKTAGLEYELTNYPAKRLYRNLSSGNTELFIGIKGAPEYHDKVYYSKIPISQIQLRVYALGDTPLPKKKEDIQGKSIITISGYSYAGLMNYFNDQINNIEVKSATSHHASFLMLKNKRAEYLFNYKQPSVTVLKTLDIPSIKYTNFYSMKGFVIVSKASNNAEKLIKKMEDAYAEMLRTGVVKYIENDDD